MVKTTAAIVFLNTRWWLFNKKEEENKNKDKNKNKDNKLVSSKDTNEDNGKCST